MNKTIQLYQIALFLLLGALAALSLGYWQQRQQLSDYRQDIEGLVRQFETQQQGIPATTQGGYPAKPVSPAVSQAPSGNRCDSLLGMR